MSDSSAYRTHYLTQRTDKDSNPVQFHGLRDERRTWPQRLWRTDMLEATRLIETHGRAVCEGYAQADTLRAAAYSPGDGLVEQSAAGACSAGRSAPPRRVASAAQLTVIGRRICNLGSN